MPHPLVVHCRQEPFGVYIGRANGARFHYGNPFSHRCDTLASVQVSSREEAVAAFEEWLDGAPRWVHIEPERRQWILNNLPALRGRKLGCFCAPLLCHGEVLARLANA